MKNKLLKWKLRAIQKNELPPTNIIVFDIDNTIFESVGTYEKDYDLKKFIKDNSFFRNLLTKKLPLFYAIENYYYDKNFMVIIQTARAKKWWLPLVLFLRGVKYHYLIQRPTSNNQATGKLKKSQLVDFILRHNEIKNPFIAFVDDSKENRDEIETLKFAHVYDADYYNYKKGGKI
tara:strand:+ start:2975 stop:3502 length:528 start_codon:yes stop_codon:yes gene_type:complete